MSAYDPLNSGFGDSSAQDTLNPQWNDSSHTPGYMTSTGAGPAPAGATPPIQSVTQQPDRGPFGREPQIYGQPEPGLISPATNTASNGQSFERPEPYIRIRITGMDRNRRDILIKFDAQTNLPNFTGQTYRNISRSYFEFQQFAEQITYSNPQTIVPALPLSQTSAPSDDEDDRLVKYMLQRWFSRICEDPFILQDEELRLFVESDFGYQPTPRPRRKTNSSFSLLKRGVPDEDEDLQRARFELTKLETQYFDVARSVDRLSRARKALSIAQSEMGNKLVNISTSEGHPPLAHAFKKFGRAWHSLADLDQAQAISECVVLGDSLGYQGINARAAKETLLQRAGVLEEHHAAVKNTINKRRQIERMKASTNIRPDKVDEALEELEEATKFEEMLARRVDGISQNLHRGLHRQSRLAQDDITVALIENARSSILYEKQILRELESLRTDFNNAAKPAPPPTQTVGNIAPVRPLTPPQMATGSWTVPRAQGSQQQQGQGPPLDPRTSGVVPPKNTLPHIYTQQTVNSGSLSASTATIQGPVSSGPVLSNPNPLHRSAPAYTSSTSAPPSAIAGPGFMQAPNPLGPPLSSPGAGPSSARPLSTGVGIVSASPSINSAHAASSSSHIDGTKSMLITPTHTQAPVPAAGQIPSGSRGFDPLLSPGGLNRNTSVSSVGIANGNGFHQHPLAASMMPPSTAGQGQLPLQGNTSNLQASQYGTMRRKLDAREAAAKLANFL
ncbi:hypothetical protein Clacol_001363 [Clathrus columnatus]|uniref:PX domain-containing protein n=1 Tax=Clathrus columnatus TaxID=1419009 RepID=A0AAV5A1R8_9AGAM|nr:hypothetical protein Clacol_001363 [Clathrus columnatus]